MINTADLSAVASQLRREEAIDKKKLARALDEAARGLKDLSDQLSSLKNRIGAVEGKQRR